MQQGQKKVPTVPERDTATGRLRAEHDAGCFEHTCANEDPRALERFTIRQLQDDAAAILAEGSHQTSRHMGKPFLRLERIEALIGGIDLLPRTAMQAEAAILTITAHGLPRLAGMHTHGAQAIGLLVELCQQLFTLRSGPEWLAVCHRQNGEK